MGLCASFSEWHLSLPLGQWRSRCCGLVSHFYRPSPRPFVPLAQGRGCLAPTRWVLSCGQTPRVSLLGCHLPSQCRGLGAALPSLATRRRSFLHPFYEEPLTLTLAAMAEPELHQPGLRALGSAAPTPSGNSPVFLQQSYGEGPHYGEHRDLPSHNSVSSSPFLGAGLVGKCLPPAWRARGRSGGERMRGGTW